MSHMTIRMGDRGRLVIPGEVRKRLGLKQGSPLILKEVDGEIHLEPVSKTISSLRGIYADIAPGRSLADELIEDRREEARNE